MGSRIQRRGRTRAARWWPDVHGGDIDDAGVLTVSDRAAATRAAAQTINAGKSCNVAPKPKYPRNTEAASLLIGAPAAGTGVVFGTSEPVLAFCRSVTSPSSRQSDPRPGTRVRSTPWQRWTSRGIADPESGTPLHRRVFERSFHLVRVRPTSPAAIRSMPRRERFRTACIDRFGRYGSGRARCCRNL